MKTYRCLAIGTGLLVALSSTLPAEFFNHSAYDAVLRRYVDQDGWVDYASVQQNSLTSLESYFERGADADLAGWSKDERLAFWINAYNARVIYWVAQKPAIKKISEDVGLFNRPFKIAGQTLSLNDIEHRILRGTRNKENGKGPIPVISFDKVDPRIHFALVCGAVGCPKLRNFAYTAENMEVTLQVNAVSFANSPKYIQVLGNHLEMSSLLKWYQDDFKAVGGVPAYISSLLLPSERLDAEDVQGLLATAYKKTVFRYDWTVNDPKNKPSQAERLAPAPEEIPPDALSASGPDLGGLK